MCVCVCVCVCVFLYRVSTVIYACSKCPLHITIHDPEHLLRGIHASVCVVCACADQSTHTLSVCVSVCGLLCEYRVITPIYPQVPPPPRKNKKQKTKPAWVHISTLEKSSFLSSVCFVRVKKRKEKKEEQEEEEATFGKL